MTDSVHSLPVRSKKNFQWLLVLAIWVLWTTPAWAQSTPSDSTAFQLQQFRPWGDPDGLFQAQSGASLGQWNFKVGLYLNYAKDPLILRVLQGNSVIAAPSERINIIEHQVAADLMFGIGFFDWLDLEVQIPVTFYQFFDSSPSGGLHPAVAGTLQNRNLTGTFFSDIKIGVKLRALNEKEHWMNLAFKIYLGIPSGNKESFNGEETVSFGASLLMNKRVGIANLTLNIGYRFLPRTQFVNLVISHELTYGLGVGVEAIKKRLELIAELSGATALTENVSVASAPMEALLGARIYLLKRSKALALNLGVGLPLLPGYGTPQVRVFAGLTFARQVFDQDKDGIPDEEDKCPKVPGPRDNMGCPWPDTDGDGLTDNIDKCPKRFGPKKNKGCPWGDFDKDGLKDNVDKCPKRPGPIENKGCPWPDRDGDGIHDKIDACPDKAGKKEFNGCPDTDGDGLHDKIDACPLRKGPKENSGCPDTDGDGFHDGIDKCPKKWGPPKPSDPPKTYKLGCPIAVKRGGKILILDKIYFEFNRSRILKKSFYVMDNVAKILVENPNIRIRVEGHTDRIGSYRYNMGLSRRRARSVVKYLLGKGIARRRMISRGYGYTKPVDTNKTQAGRDRNRRVEFTIIGKTKSRIKRVNRNKPVR